MFCNFSRGGTIYIHKKNKPSSMCVHLHNTPQAVFLGHTSVRAAHTCSCLLMYEMSNIRCYMQFMHYMKTINIVRYGTRDYTSRAHVSFPHFLLHTKAWRVDPSATCSISLHVLAGSYRMSKEHRIIRRGMDMFYVCAACLRLHPCA